MMHIHMLLHACLFLLFSNDGVSSCNFLSKNAKIALWCFACTEAHCLLFVQYAHQPWVAFVRDCELFTLPPTCSQGSSCTKPVSASPWWLRVFNVLWRPVTYEYGTGLVPNKGEGWQHYHDEGEVRVSSIHRLTQKQPACTRSLPMFCNETMLGSIFGLNMSQLPNVALPLPLALFDAQIDAAAMD